MLSLLNNTNFFSQYGLLIVLVVALVVLMFISFNRRKKEDAFRTELIEKIVPGAKIKTYYGLYGKVLKVTETTDGKILLVETGEDKKVSYQNIHINAVYGLDETQVVVLDENGLPVDEPKKSESELRFEELEKQLAEKEAETKEEVKEEVKADKPAKKTTTKKTSTTSKKSTTAKKSTKE